MTKVRFKLFALMFILLTACCCSVFVFNSNRIKNANAQEVMQNVSVEYFDEEATEKSVASKFEKGTVIGAGEYPVGATVTLTAVPKDGCVFVRWLDDEGNTLSTETVYTFTIEKDTKIKAKFDYATYNVVDSTSGALKLNAVNYVHDEERFDAEDLLNYKRASVVDNKIGGVFYYGDVATFSFTPKIYLKELSSTYFKLNKEIILIAVDEDDKILYEESYNTKFDSYAGTSIADYVFDNDTNDYVIVKYKKLSTNLIVDSVDIKVKIDKNIDLIFNPESCVLQLVKFSGYLNDKQNNISSFLGQIKIEYGFYDLIDNSLVTNADDLSVYYLAQVGYNFKIAVSNSDYYTYEYANAGEIYNSNIIAGTLTEAISGFSFYFVDVKYAITFKQVVNVNGKLIDADQEWLNLENQNLLPGQTISMNYADKSIKILKEDLSVLQTIDFDFNAVYGFEFFGFSLSADTFTENNAIEYTVNKDAPVGATIYVVLTYIDYNITFACADYNGAYSEYLTSKVLDLPKSGVYNRNSQIVLTSTVPVGFKELGWTLKHGSEIEEVNQFNFRFVPTSNETDVYYYQKVDYTYNNFTLSLNGFDAEGNPVAYIGLYVINEIVFNGDVLNIKGKSYDDTLGKSFNIPTTKIADKENTYSSLFGEIKVFLNQDNSYNYLTFNDNKFIYNGTSFVIGAAKNRTEINSKFNKIPDDASTTEINERAYNINLSNVCCDDLIIACSTTFDTTYKFLHFVYSGTNTALATNVVADFNDMSNVSYVIVRNYEDKKLIASYAEIGSNILIKSNNGSAFSVYNFEPLFSGSFGKLTLAGVEYWELSNVLGTVTLTIPKSMITVGYAFAGITEELNSEKVEHLVGATEIKENSVGYTYSFESNTKYNGAIITLNFVEIVYTVNVETTASIDLTDNANGLVENVKSFEVSWSKLESEPTLTLSTRYGYYVSTAYFKEDTNLNKVGALIGNDAEQTENKKYTIKESDFKRLIIGLSENNAVTLFIVEKERTFNVVVQYIVGGMDSAVSASNAIITCQVGSNESNILTATAQGTTFNSVYGYYAIFEGLKFGDNILLNMNDDNVAGQNFGKWEIAESVIQWGSSEREFTSKELGFVLNADYFVIAHFDPVRYNIEFKGYSEGQETDEFAKFMSSMVNDSLSSDFHVTDNLTLLISEKVGYAYESACIILKDGTEVELHLEENNDVYYYTWSDFLPINLFESVKQDSTLIVHVYFVEKLYSINNNIVNNTKDKRGKEYNSTGIDVGKWSEVVSIKYYDGNNYVEKPADENGVIKYSTNDYLQIKFNPTFNGIKLDYVYLGDIKFKVVEGTTNVSGQDIVLAFENGEFTLVFCLNSELLETSLLTDIFNVYYTYSIKQYTITFTTNTINSVFLLKNYKITNSAVKGAETRTNTAGKALSLSKVYYGEDWQLATDYTNNEKDFANKYYFRSFIYGTGEDALRFNMQDPNIADPSIKTYSFKLTGAIDGFESIWSMIGNNLTPTFYAYFEPKITLNGFETMEDALVKKLVYNGLEQKLSTVVDNVDLADIVYAEELGAIEVLYINNGASVTPKNAGVYTVKIRVQEIEYSGKVELHILKAGLEFVYSGFKISKTYDNKNDLTAVNLVDLKNQFTLNGLMAADLQYACDVSNITGYFAESKAIDKVDIFFSGIGLPAELSKNYDLVNPYFDPVLKNYKLQGVGQILKRELTIDKNAFVFNNIVYKPDQEYALKYIVGDLSFKQDIADDDCYIDAEKIEYTLKNYSIGENRAVEVNLQVALSGTAEDVSNYYINTLIYYINIHPYEITFDVPNYRTFKIVDIDELCVIPIDITTLYVEIIDSTSPLYPENFSKIENHILRSEKVYSFYEFAVSTSKGNTIDVSNLAGAYIVLTQIKDLKVVYNLAEEVSKISYANQDGNLVVKIDETTNNTLAFTIEKSYLPIWKILLIVLLLLLLLLVIVIVVIIYKKTRRKRDDRIY